MATCFSSDFLVHYYWIGQNWRNRSLPERTSRPLLPTLLLNTHHALVDVKVTLCGSAIIIDDVTLNWWHLLHRSTLELSLSQSHCWYHIVLISCHVFLSLLCTNLWSSSRTSIRQSHKYICPKEPTFHPLDCYNYSWWYTHTYGKFQVVLISILYICLALP